MKTKPTIHALLIGAAALLASGLASAQEQQQEISRSASRPTVDGPAQFFTGRAHITPQFEPNADAPITGGYVTFEPGARSAWHTHPTGQRLLIVSGTAWTQVWGGPIVELKAGDVLWCPPGVKHWHGASPTESMTQLALTGTVNGKNVNWMEKVTDAQYRK